jgi:hypothetical protein
MTLCDVRHCGRRARFQMETREDWIELCEDHRPSGAGIVRLDR